VPLILNAGEWPASHPAALPPGTAPPPNKSRSRLLGNRKILLPLPGIVPQFLGCPACGLAELTVIAVMLQLLLLQLINHLEGQNKLQCLRKTKKEIILLFELN
jgi:hypothetical protein